MKKNLFFTAALFMANSCLYAQAPVQQTSDKAIFQDHKPGYYQNTVMKGIEDQNEKKEAPKTEKLLRVDIGGRDVPQSPAEFTTVWRNTPVSQGNTGTCWCFSTTSYFETEINRITKQNIMLSQLYTVYWEYVEKAKYYVKTRGTSNFSEGSEANAVSRIYGKYGAIPYEQYSGLPGDQKIYDHSTMITEMANYLKSVKDLNAWNEDEVVATIKSIMNHYMGTPPANAVYQGKTMTPQDYLKNVCKLNMNDYVDVMSLMQTPYWKQTEYKVPDNWWHDSSYYNVPLDTFMSVLNRAIRTGYSVSIGGDVSEPGFNVNNVCVIPSFDIPSQYIDESARQFRFSNGTTGDDHGMHLVGYEVRNGRTWYLIKDSGSGSRNVGKDNPSFGYYYFDQDYVKLKMVDFMVNKEVIKNLLPNFKI